MLYLSLAGLSFLFAVGAVSGAYAGLRSSVSSFEISQFVNALNSAMLSGSSFSGNLFVPGGLCSSTLQGNEIFTAYGVYYLEKAASFGPGALCPDGTYATISISENGGSAYVSRDN
jgi:hypothetical protein